MKEIWKDIPNYEHLYQVSNVGRVRSKDKEWYAYNYRKKDMSIVKMKGRIMKQGTTNCNYKQVHLSKNGIEKVKSVHRLVAEVFIPNPNNLPCVNHKDGNKQNNCVENLEWCSFSYNVKNAYENNLSKSYLKGKFGKLHNVSKKVNQYDKNNNFIKQWDCISDASRELKIDNGRITKCCQHKKYCYTAGGYKWEYVN